jgi:hypothetical protein
LDRPENVRSILGRITAYFSCVLHCWLHCDMVFWFPRCMRSHGITFSMYPYRLMCCDDIPTSGRTLLPLSYSIEVMCDGCDAWAGVRCRSLPCKANAISLILYRQTTSALQSKLNIPQNIQSWLESHASYIDLPRLESGHTKHTIKSPRA